MPPVKVHYDSSKGRKGREFKELHNWIDGPEKPLKHDLSRLKENLEYAGDKFGVAGADEYLIHLLEDLEHKISKAKREYYLGVLRSAGVPEEAVKHCEQVAEKALGIARVVKIKTNETLIEQGALFHDIGKAKTYGLEHGKIGAELAANLGLHPECIAIIEKHIRGGMSRNEARELGLPVKDYSLKTPEEKIVIYSDRLVDIIQDGVASDEEAELKFEEILRKYEKYGKNPRTTERYIKLRREIHGWMKM